MYVINHANKVLKSKCTKKYLKIIFKIYNVHNSFCLTIR